MSAMVLFQGILDARRNRFCLAEAGTVTCLTNLALPLPPHLPRAPERLQRPQPDFVFRLVLPTPRRHPSPP